MRKFISGLLAIAAAAFTGCYESGTDADNTSREARISISPAAIGFDADGRTTDCWPIWPDAGFSLCGTICPSVRRRRA